MKGICLSILLIFFFLKSNSQTTLNWTARSVNFTDGVSNLVAYINLGNIVFWGYLEITLTDSFGKAHSMGLYQKTFNLGCTTTEFHSNTSEVTSAIGSVCDQWKLGEFQRNASNHLVVPIYHLTSWGNRVTVAVKGITLGAIVPANFVLTAPQVIPNTVTRDYQNVTDKLAIGTTKADPDAHLTVAGNINAKELKVKVNAGADFVFEPEYQLPDLSFTEAFVKEHRRLPGIPSATEMQKQGLTVGEFQIKLLQKIEELTLHLIALKKDYDDLKRKIN